MTERRYDPTSGEWVTFATHRQNRTYKPKDDFCPLCPTKDESAPTEIPSEHFEIVTFDNRFPAYSIDAPVPDVADSSFYRVLPASGRCEVIVYSDDHSLTFADLPLSRLRMLVEVWIDRWKILGEEAQVSYVMPFENKGEVVGTTLSHPHGQIYGYPNVPPRAQRELEAAAQYLQETGRCVECDVIAAELEGGDRVVYSNGSWLAWVPFWARFPYEVHVAPKLHRPSLIDLTMDERADFADILSVVAKSYDCLFGFSLPYIMAFHQRPTDSAQDWDPISHFHVEFAPPHRSSDKLKYLAGSELAGGAFITDVVPEMAAERIRKAGALIK